VLVLEYQWKQTLPHFVIDQPKKLRIIRSGAPQSPTNNVSRSRGKKEAGLVGTDICYATKSLFELGFRPIGPCIVRAEAF
jgi:hypothetical protein